MRQIILGLMFLMMLTACELPSNLLAIVGSNNIYCNDYEFTCCADAVSRYNSEWGTRSGDIYTCDGSADRCNVQISVSDNYLSVYKASSISGCTYTSGVWTWENQYTCPGEVNIGKNVNYDLKPLEVVYLKGAARTTAPFFTVGIDVYKSKLFFTGRAASTTGIPVSGADKCTFQTNNNIYGDSGQLLKQSTGTISYSVPKGECVLSYQSGDRHICGDKSEECNVDTDCTGHTYGNVECYARTLQTYGCRKFSDPNQQSDYDIGWTLGQDLSYTASRCEIVSTRQVQCCGDTDCGTNAFCDRKTWTCSQDVECTNNYDCGVSQTCDWTTKSLKTPTCSAGSCGYTSQSVECCSDVNCPTGYFCGADRKCKQSSIPKLACPFGCCYQELSYVDKPCLSSQTCCGDHECRADCGSAQPPINQTKNWCEAQEGRKWVCTTTDPAWWKIWESPIQTCNCMYEPHLSFLGIILIIGGVALFLMNGFYFGGMPPVSVGAIIMLLTGLLISLLAILGQI